MSSCSLRSQARSSARTLASSAPNGSSGSSTRGLDGERAGERHPLPLPAGQFGGVAVGEPVEVNQFQEFGDALADVVAGSAADFRPKATLSQTVM